MEEKKYRYEVRMISAPLSSVELETREVLETTCLIKYVSIRNCYILAKRFKIVSIFAFF